MEFGTNKIKKVVWLCHLNNKIITDKLGVKPDLEFAPWISSFADIFNQKGLHEIHIISPHKSLIISKSFRDKNIIYHFFPYTIPIIPKRIFNFIHWKTNHWWNKRKIRNIVRRINPDLIHLFGTENIYYTSAIIQFKSIYPILVTIQGFINYVDRDSQLTNYNKRKEIEIIKNLKHFGIRDNEMKSFILRFNSNATFHYHEIAPYVPKFHSEVQSKKKYDIVFFGRICKQKGVEDVIYAVKIIKELKANISAIIIGPADIEYKNYLYKIINELSLKENISILDATHKIDDLHKIVSQAIVSVLPTYADTIPGTILESMQIGIPCVSYPVGGIPKLNEELESVKLVEKGNIKMLSSTILNILNDEKLREDLVLNSKIIFNRKWSSETIFQQINVAYERIEK